jgi:hypothetical protein
MPYQPGATYQGHRYLFQGLVGGIDDGLADAAQKREREKQEAEEDKLMADEMKRLQGIAQHLGVPQGKASSMSRGELLGEIEGRGSVLQRNLQEQTLATSKAQQKEAELGRKTQQHALNQQMLAPWRQGMLQRREDQAIAGAVPSPYRPGVTDGGAAMRYMQGGGQDKSRLQALLDMDKAAMTTRSGGVSPQPWTHPKTGQEFVYHGNTLLPSKDPSAQAGSGEAVDQRIDEMMKTLAVAGRDPGMGGLVIADYVQRNFDAQGNPTTEDRNPVYDKLVERLNAQSLEIYGEDLFGNKPAGAGGGPAQPPTAVPQRTAPLETEDDFFNGF